jgi:hypothetical protein
MVRAIESESNDHDYPNDGLRKGQATFILWLVVHAIHALTRAKFTAIEKVGSTNQDFSNWLSAESQRFSVSIAGEAASAAVPW